MLFLYIFFCNVFFFYIHGDNGSGILNVFKTNKHLNTLQNHWVVQIRLHILAIRLLRTTSLFLLDHPVFCNGNIKKKYIYIGILYNFFTSATSEEQGKTNKEPAVILSKFMQHIRQNYENLHDRGTLHSVHSINRIALELHQE